MLFIFLKDYVFKVLLIEYGEYATEQANYFQAILVYWDAIAIIVKCCLDIFSKTLVFGSGWLANTNFYF
jgi:hypothetical protein